MSAEPLLKLKGEEVVAARPVVKKAFYITLVGCVFALVVVFRLHHREFQDQSTPLAIWTFLLSASVPLTILYRLVFNLRPKVFAKFYLFADYFQIGKSTDSKVVRWEHIESVSFSMFSPRFFGGFTLRTREGSQFRFPSLFLNTGLLIRLIAKAKPNLLDEQRLSRFLKLDEALSFTWERSQLRVRKYWYFYVFRYFLVPALISMPISRYLGLDWGITFFMVAPICAAIIFGLNLIDERIWLKSFASGIVRTQKRDRHYMVAFDLVYLAVVILVTYLLTTTGS